MAPSVEPTLLEIYIWPLLTAVIDGQPAIGAKLYSYAPGTSTPDVCPIPMPSPTPAMNCKPPARSSCRRV